MNLKNVDFCDFSRVHAVRAVRTGLCNALLNGYVLKFFILASLLGCLRPYPTNAVKMSDNLSSKTSNHFYVIKIVGAVCPINKWMPPIHTKTLSSINLHCGWLIFDLHIVLCLFFHNYHYPTPKSKCKFPSCSPIEAEWRIYASAT